MASRVFLTAKAESDIAAVLEWFRDQRAIEAGGRWLTGLLAKMDSLATNAERFHVALESDEIGEEIRELIYGKGRFKHRLLFRIVDPAIYILRVWHSSRDAFTRDDML